MFSSGYFFSFTSLTGVMYGLRGSDRCLVTSGTYLATDCLARVVLAAEGFLFKI